MIISISFLTISPYLLVSTQILRDLAILQIHIRDLSGHVETRMMQLPKEGDKKMPPAQQNERLIGFAVANQLAGNPEKAIPVLSKIEASFDMEKVAAEEGEVLLYHANVLRMAGENAKALQLLESPLAVKAVYDEVYLAEALARLKWETSKYSAALNGFLELIISNPDNQDHHDALRVAFLKVADTDKKGAIPLDDQLLALYGSLISRFPSCRTLTWTILEGLEASHPAFRSILSAFLRAGIRKGIPSLFSDISKLWASGLKNKSRLWPSRSSVSGPSKKDIVFELASSLHVTCLSGGKFTFPIPDAPKLSSWPSSGSSVPTILTPCSRKQIESLFSARGDRDQEDASAYPFAALLFASILDSTMRSEEAIQVLDKAILHSPTVLELYLLKGKILKHLGKYLDAAITVDLARVQDLADRYLNSKAVKYWLRCDNVEEGERLIGLFARHDAQKPHADPLVSVRDVQAFWFEIASGQAYERRGDFGRALRRYAHIEGIYDQIHEDAYEYHGYCIRRTILRAYSSLMHGSARRKGCAYYLNAACGAARVFLTLSRNKPILDTSREKALAAASAAEVFEKSVKEKQDKSPTATAIALIAAQTAASTAAAEAASAVGTLDEAENAKLAASAQAALASAEEEDKVAKLHAELTGIDLDPEGSKLLAIEDPLKEAWRHARLANDALFSEFAIPGRASDLASSQVAYLPTTTTEGITPRPDRRSARAALVAVEVHALNAEIALELAKHPEAVAHFSRAEELLSNVAALFADESFIPSIKKHVSKLQGIASRIRGTNESESLVKAIEKLISSLKLVN
jgi:peptide alpha-N-acetyltransferase